MGEANASVWTETDQAYADFVSEIACEVSADEEVVSDVLGALEERGLFSVSDAAAALLAQNASPTPPVAATDNEGGEHNG